MEASTARFADAMTCALLQDARHAVPAAIARLASQPGFAVYRNTVIRSCVDALQANFPAVARLVGVEWFRHAATLYVRAHPPTDPALVAYGDCFAAFLATFSPAHALPYLPGVARLDRLWTEVHGAPDDEGCDASEFAKLEPAALARNRVRPCAAVRWAWFDMPIVTIWRRNRDERTCETVVDWHGEGVLLTRPRGHVRVAAFSVGGVGFLDTCAAGGTLADAGAAALAADPDIELSCLFADLIAAGAFACVTASPTAERADA